MFETDKIAFVSQVSDVAMYVALTVGLLIFVVGYFAGARYSLRKIFVCTLVVAAVGTVALRIPMALHDVVQGGKKAPAATSQQMNGKTSVALRGQAVPAPAKEERAMSISREGIANLLIYVVWTSFLVGMGIFLYETLIVTSREAFGGLKR